MTNEICDEVEDDQYDGDTLENVFSGPAVRLVERDPNSHRVDVVQSPVLYTFYRQHPMAITLDTGATTNMIRASTASVCKLPITPASKFARNSTGRYWGDPLHRHQRKFVFPTRCTSGQTTRRRCFGSKSFPCSIIGGTDSIYYGTDECKAGVASVRRTQTCEIPARRSSYHREIT